MNHADPGPIFMGVTVVYDARFKVTAPETVTKTDIDYYWVIDDLESYVVRSSRSQSV